MKVNVKIIDNKGFIHFKTAKSVRLLKEWISTLKKGTDVHWASKTDVTISQQYIRSD